MPPIAFIKAADGTPHTASGVHFGFGHNIWTPSNCSSVSITDYLGVAIIFH